MNAPRRSSAPRRSVAADLTARVLVAIPAIAYAVFIIAYGGWVFAIGILVLGFVCLHELFRMYETVRPIKLAAFIAIAGLAVAAEQGNERQVLLALVAFVPLMFLFGALIIFGLGVLEQARPHGGRR